MTIFSTVMLLTLILSFFVGVLKEINLLSEKFSWGNRDVFLHATLLFGLFTWLSTEGFSAIHRLTTVSLYIFWSIVLAFLMVLFVSLRRRRHPNFRAFIDFADWKYQLPQPLHLISRILISLLFLELAILAVEALIYPPLTGDGLTYHLPRIMHWIQNQSLDPYATNIDRQIQMPPFGEYLLLHLFSLSNSDIFGNLFQWVAFLGSIVGISNIAKKLNANIEVQLLSSIFFASTPTNILEATSTQNDLVVCFAVILFVNTWIEVITDPKNTIYAISCGLALGLAILTKGTAYVFVAPFCLVLATYILIKSKKEIASGMLIVFIAMLLNTPYYYRNISVFNAPLGPDGTYANKEYSLASFSSNLIRNTALHFTQAWPGDKSDINPILRGLKWLHGLTGYDEIDPRNTMTMATVFHNQNSALSFHEDYVGNPIHVILIILAIIVFIPTYKKYSSLMILFFISLIGIIVLYSGYLNYQISGTRLQVTIFALFSPFVMLAFSKLNENWTRYLAIGLALLSFVWVFHNSNQPYGLKAISMSINRRYDLFQPYYRENIENVTSAIADSECHNLGLNYGGELEEYRIWALLKSKGWKGRIEHVSVRNKTKFLMDPSFQPCAVITDEQKRAAKYPDYTIIQGDPFILLFKP